MKKTIAFSPFLLVCAMLLNSNCSNSPKTENTAKDTTIKTDTLAKLDTTSKVSVTQNETPPPPPQLETRFIEMRAVEIIDDDMDPPPIMDANVNPYSQTNGDPIVADATGPIPEMDTKIYAVVDQKPEMYMLREFLFDNMIYPETAMKAGIQGVSTIGFVVNESGMLSNIKVVNSSGNNELDNEAIRVIRKTNGRWKPGRINGNAVKSQMSIPITFEIDE